MPAREAHELSSADVTAALARYGVPTRGEDVRGWEAGKHPRLEALGALSQVLGVSAETLLHGEEEAARIAETRANTAS